MTNTNKYVPLPNLDMPLGGFVSEGYEPVLHAFIENFQQHNEVGASFAVFHRGELVVDLWGGYADKELARPWDKDTLMVVFSATKGIAAICLLMLADRGLLDYDAAVAQYWPEFAQNGKQDITVRQLLSHVSGLSALETPLAIAELATEAGQARFIAALESQKPFWEPGTDQGYNAISFGGYAAELFKRVAKQDMAEFFRNEIQQKMQADFWIGNADSQQNRIGKLYQLSTFARLRKMLPEIIRGGTTESNVGRAFLKPGSLVKKAFTNPDMGEDGAAVYNSEVAQTTPMWWGGGFSNARGLAHLYAPMAGDGSFAGYRLVGKETLATVYPRRSWSEKDRILGKPAGWNQGFLKEETSLFSPNTESFGHSGMGGTLGWADPVAEMSFGYVMNAMDHRIRSPRCVRLCHALYASPALQ